MRASGIGLPDRAVSLAASMAPQTLPHRHQPEDDPAVILFTSGSAGRAPPGHPDPGQKKKKKKKANLHPHRARPRLDVFQSAADRPLLGATGGFLLPMLGGMKAFQYPSPLHA